MAGAHQLAAFQKLGSLLLMSFTETGEPGQMTVGDCARRIVEKRVAQAMVSRKWRNSKFTFMRKRLFLNIKDYFTNVKRWAMVGPTKKGLQGQDQSGL
jgi:hypothetical protein